jgi:hypothetical protein
MSISISFDTPDGRVSTRLSGQLTTLTLKGVIDRMSGGLKIAHTFKRRHRILTGIFRCQSAEATVELLGETRRGYRYGLSLTADTGVDAERLFGSIMTMTVRGPQVLK